MQLTTEQAKRLKHAMRNFDAIARAILTTHEVTLCGGPFDGKCVKMDDKRFQKGFYAIPSLKSTMLARNLDELAFHVYRKDETGKWLYLGVA